MTLRGEDESTSRQWFHELFVDLPNKRRRLANRRAAEKQQIRRTQERGVGVLSAPGVSCWGGSLSVPHLPRAERAGHGTRT